MRPSCGLACFGVVRGFGFMKNHLARSGGIYHWRVLFEMLAWPGVRGFLVELGFSGEEDSVMSHAVGAAEAIDRALTASSNQTTSPEEFASLSETALQRGLSQFTPDEAQIALRLGDRSQGEGARAFSWRSAILWLTRRADTAALDPALSVSSLAELRTWRTRDEQRSDAVRHAAASEPPTPGSFGAEHDSNLISLLGVLAYDVVFERIARWPQSEQDNLFELVRQELSAHGIREELVREPWT
jgi:hypothetical protein